MDEDFGGRYTVVGIMGNRQQRIERRAFINFCSMAALGMATAFMLALPAQAESRKQTAPLHPAVKYMQITAAELMKAQYRPSVKRFADIIGRRADVHAIAMYSLGRYQQQLSGKQKALYVRGVHQFMARYFADQAHRYRVKKAIIEQTPRKEGNHWLVRSKVTLTDGRSYNVTWKLNKTRAGWRVRDVKVMGFSLTFLQRGLFYKFLQKKNGDVGALVMALNR